MRLVFLGLSLSSSWGNGHATTYRALIRALAARGHQILFLEREQPWYASNRDLSQPEYCRLAFYAAPAELRRFRKAFARADAVVIGSYVPDAALVLEEVSAARGGLLCFYDIDTPVTLRKLASGDPEYLTPDMVPAFDLYLSFTGGPALRILENVYGARMARPLYCSVDSGLYRPTLARKRWDLGYLGTYSADRQPGLEELLLEVAAQLPQRRLVVAGSLYPQDVIWPENVDRIEHLPPARHADFYSSLRWALNVTRADMVQSGFSPSVRLFEASACGTPILTDSWPGLGNFFTPGRELLVVESTEGVVQTLEMSPKKAAAIGATGRRRTLRDHTAERRARQLESYLEAIEQPEPLLASWSRLEPRPLHQADS